MEKAIVVRGKLSDPRHIELDEPVTDLRGPVEVVVRPAPPGQGPVGQDIFDLMGTQSPGTRSKSDIDRQIREERDAWGSG
ncbi:MAG: hypothetical protein ACRDGM_05260 [bacterium]